jgi:hypothetical protein
MKLILCFCLFLSSTITWADSFTVIKEGKEYLCEEKNPVLDPGGALKCIEKAYSGPFSKSESERICAGARDERPAICAIAAYAGPFSKEESIRLCVRAKSNGPIDCASKAYAGPFSKEESLTLCTGGTLANADCAIKAYAGPYTKEEAIRLCKAEPYLLLKSLNLLEQSSEIQEKMRLLKK